MTTGGTARPAPEPVDVAQAPPVGAPGPWTQWIDYLGGDDILIEADAATAERFLVEGLGWDDLDAECGCEFGCGPLWDQREGGNADGSFPTRPVSVEEEQGRRWDDTARTRVFTAGQVAASLGAR